MLIISNVAKRIFGSRNQRVIKRLYKLVSKINALENVYEQLNDQALRAKTDEFRQRLKEGETLDGLLIEAFAVVREASKRTLKMRHFDVQLLHQWVEPERRRAPLAGKLAESVSITVNKNAARF